MGIQEAEARKTIHDLNNVLATVLGSAELIMADTKEGSQIHADAGSICAAALRGRGLIEELRVHVGLP